MNSLNQIIIEGNLTRDLELKTMPSGKNVCTMPIAVNRTFKNKDGQFVDEVSYFDVDTYGNLAELCAKWCPKGRGVRVVGRLKQERWTDNEGKNRSKVKILAEHIEFKPVYKKEGSSQTAVAEKNGPADAYAGNPPPTKKEKLAMLAEAAAAAQNETEDNEGSEVTF